MSFEEYLVSKKIDSEAFHQSEPERWNEWNKIFIDLATESFTAQKLYLINPVRRRFPLKHTAPLESPTPVPEAKPRPVIQRPKFR